SFFSPLRGLFALSPFLVLGFLGIRRIWRERSHYGELGAVAIFTGLLMLGYVYFTSSFSYASWGWTTGPRHLTGLIPFLVLPAALVIDGARVFWQRALFAGLAVVSVLVTASLTFVNYIPDDVSEPVFELFLPLARAGYVVPTALGFAGAPSPAPGYVL